MKDAAPLLKDLAEAGKLQATVTTEQAEAAERFNKTLFAMRTAAEDAGRALTFGLGESLAATVENWNAATTAFGGFSAALRAVLSGSTQLKDDPAAGLREYNEQLKVMDARIRAVQDGSDGFRGRFADERIKSLQAERAEIAKVADFYRTLVNAGSAGAGRGSAGLSLPKLAGPTGKPSRVTPPKEEISAASQALATYVLQLERELFTLQELSTEEEALNKLKEIGALGQNLQVKERVLGLAREIDLQRQGVEFARAMNTEMERQRNEQAGLDEALARYSGRTADALKQAQTARLEARLAAGDVFSPEELDRIRKGIGGIKEEAERTFNGAEKALDRFAENVQDALGNTVEATLRGDFDNIGKLWGDLLVKMASQAIAADVGAALFGNVGKADSVSGGLLAELVGAFTGGTLSGARASGGPVSAGGAYLIGEDGPEILQMGSRSGSVLPNSALSAGGSRSELSINMPVSIQIDARTDQAQVAQLVAGAMAQTQRDMWAQLHARGLA